MSGPFIFIATNRLKEGKLEDERKRVPELCGFIEANEPRVIAFNEYAIEDGTEVGVVQVHPDAESMEFHMRPSLSGRSAPYADTLDARTSIQVYGGTERRGSRDVEATGGIGGSPDRQALPPRGLHARQDKLSVEDLSDAREQRRIGRRISVVVGEWLRLSISFLARS
jgi:hypothetical protein